MRFELRSAQWTIEGRIVFDPLPQDGHHLVGWGIEPAFEFRVDGGRELAFRKGHKIATRQPLKRLLGSELKALLQDLPLRLLVVRKRALELDRIPPCGLLFLEPLESFDGIGGDENTSVVRIVGELALEGAEYAIARKPIDCPSAARLPFALMPFAVARSIDAELEAGLVSPQELNRDGGRAPVDEFEQMAN